MVQLQFRSEQRRRMIDEKKAAEQMLGRIKQSKETVIATARAEVNTQRPIRLNRIYAEQLKKNATTAGSMESLEATPGPGTYFKDQASKAIVCLGGYMASSRVESMPNENPGPGHYQVNNDAGGGRGGTGCVPFSGRGKTDVDVLVQMSKKLPGVGQYDVGGGAKSKRAVTLLPKGTTELDKVISRATKLPGPGDYNLDVASSPAAVPNSIEAYILGMDSGFLKRK